MLRNEFDESMRRVLAFSKPVTTQAEIDQFVQYLTALYEAVANWTHVEFELVTLALVQRKKLNFRPDAQKFFELRRQLQDERRGEAPPEPPCRECAGTRMVSREFKRKSTQETVAAMVPCPVCRRVQHDGQAINEDLEPIVVEERRQT